MLDPEKVSADFKMTVNGEPLAVYTCRVSAMPFNRVWPGHERPIEQSETASMTGFEAGGPVTVEVECARPLKRAVVRPLSAKIIPKIEKQAVKFAIGKPGQYVLETDGIQHALHIFADEPRGYGGQNATYSFGPGQHFTGLIRLKDNDTVYIDKDAVVYGSFLGRNIKNIRFFGYGIIDGSYEKRLTGHCYEDVVKGHIRFYDSENIRIEGLTFRDSATWCVSFFGCRNIEMDRIKMVGQWRYNTDGIDIVNTSNIRIRNSFLRVFDDVISLKGIEAYKYLNVSNVNVSGCVLWSDWGHTCEVGIETICEKFENIVFEDCDCVRNMMPVLDIQNGDIAEISGVVFQNIRVEYQADAQPYVFQQSEDMQYDRFSVRRDDVRPDGTGLPYLIWADNHKYMPWYQDTYGKIRDALYKDIHIIADKGVPMPPVLIKSVNESVKFGKFTIDGLYFNGKKVNSLKELNIDQNGSAEIVLI